MKGTYTKRGSSVRIERSGRAISTLVTREHGRATLERGHFRAESLGERVLASAPDVGGATEAARRLASLEGGGVGIERLTVVTGIAEHTVTNESLTRSWTEEVARVHLSLVDRNRGLRVNIDLGARLAEELPLHVAAEAAEAIRLPAVEAPESNVRVELAPLVMASLWRFVADHPALIERSRVRLVQSTHPAWPFDGGGALIEEVAVGPAQPASVFRPSYRIAPVPAWFHLKATLASARKPRGRANEGARIIALLRPLRLTRSSVTARVLATLGGTATAADIDIPRQDFASSIIHMTGDELWFPFEAGAFGRDTVLDGVRLSPPA